MSRARFGLLAALLALVAPLAAAAEPEIGSRIARRDPQAVRALVLTEPATPEERVARRPIMASVGPCVNQGQSLRVEMAGLRAMVAVALHRLLERLSPAPATRRN